MDNHTIISRRQFLSNTATASAGIALSTGLAPARVLGANDKIRVGVLGSGGRAQYLMELFSGNSEVDICAVCDIYDPHREKALTKASAGAKGYTEYREVLATYALHQEIPVTLLDYAENGRVDLAKLDASITDKTACVLIQSPNFFGTIEEVAAIA